MLLFIGGPEIIVVLLFIVMFFGSKKIPELAKGLGKAMREVKDASNEIKKEIRDSATSIKDDLILLNNESYYFINSRFSILFFGGEFLVRGSLLLL